jgi:hypothetical protein
VVRLEHRATLQLPPHTHLAAAGNPRGARMAATRLSPTHLLVILDTTTSILDMATLIRRTPG